MWPLGKPRAYYYDSSEPKLGGLHGSWRYSQSGETDQLHKMWEKRDRKKTSSGDVNWIKLAPDCVQSRVWLLVMPRTI
jgi:hypothetical protein